MRKQLTIFWMKYAISEIIFAIDKNKRSILVTMKYHLISNKIT